MKGHQTRIAEHLGFREATNSDKDEMTSWLFTHILVSDKHLEDLKAVVTRRFRELKIEPPSTKRIERLIRSRCHTYERQLLAEIMQRLPPSTCTLLPVLQKNGGHLTPLYSDRVTASHLPGFCRAWPGD